MEQENKIEWVKCHHGHELRNGRCYQCEREKEEYLKAVFSKPTDEPPKRIAIKRGCRNSDMGMGAGCYCDGSCNEIIGYGEPLYAGEKQR